jgi:hypothetical protein
MATVSTTTRRGPTMRVPRSRGAFSGLILVVLGVWGALIPFVGPSFSYAYTPSDSWHWTLWRFWLEVLPGGAAVLGGLILIASANRVRGSVGGWLGAAAGAWFVVGLPLAPVVHIHGVGAPASSGTDTRAWETIGMFSGLGVVILLFAALALGRLAVVGVRDVVASDKFAARREADLAAREQERIDAERAAEAERAQTTRPATVDVAAAERRDAAPADARATDTRAADTVPVDTSRTAAHDDASVGSRRSARRTETDEPQTTSGAPRVHTRDGDYDAGDRSRR